MKSGRSDSGASCPPSGSYRQTCRVLAVSQSRREHTGSATAEAGTPRWCAHRAMRSRPAAAEVPPSSSKEAMTSSLSVSQM